MYKSLCFFFALVAFVAAAPKPGAILAAAPVVTATSSQVFHRNYNAALVAPAVAVAAPVVRAAPVVAAPAFASPYVAAPAVAGPAVVAPAFAPSLAAYSAYPYII